MISVTDLSAAGPSAVDIKRCIIISIEQFKHGRLLLGTCRPPTVLILSRQFLLHYLVS